MDRRDFLKNQLRGALLVGLGATGLIVPKRALAAATPDVAVVKGNRIKAVRAAVDLMGGMKEYVKPGNRVLIKPNMSFSARPKIATNTHPEVVRELAVMCREAGASKILVLDHTLQSPERCIKNSGIYDALKDIDEGMVKAVNTRRLFKEVSIPDGEALDETSVMTEALKSDVLIAAPTAKSHSATGVSLSMKGMMGLIYNRRIMHWAVDLDESIVDLCTVLKADLTVIDASRVLSTNGPGGPGKILQGNTIIASKDMVAADACAVSLFEWYGRRFKPGQVAHIKLAHERGFGRMDLENLNIKNITV
ncbi:MAG: DUF362 domain-containing protein [Deltaproteobacteria bacterium]|nr:DUF362 domain-containing protein [Deltaproteobacteria bacterium]